MGRDRNFAGSYSFATGLVVLFTMTALTPHVRAAAMPDVFPAETMVYFGWPGSDTFSNTIQGTSLHDLTLEPEVETFHEKASEALDQLILNEIDNELDRETYRIIRDLLQICWHRPLGFGVIQVGLAESGPQVDVGLIVDAGRDSQYLAGATEAILALGEFPIDSAETVTIGSGRFQELALFGPGLTLRWGVMDDLFVLTTGSALLQHLAPGWTPPRQATVETDSFGSQESAASLQGVEPDEDPVLYAAPDDEAATVAEPTPREAMPSEQQTWDAGVRGKSESLAQNRRFGEAMMEVGGGADVPVVYCDTKALIDRARALAPLMEMMSGGTMGSGQLDNMLRAWNLDKADFYCAATVPDGESFRSKSVFRTVAPKSSDTRNERSFLAGTKVAPLTRDELRWVPEDATWAVVQNTDLSAGYDEMLKSFELISPELHALLGTVVGSLEQQLNVNIRGDILPSFGDTIAIYHAPSSGGVWITGLTALIELEPQASIGELIPQLVRIGLQEVNGDDASISVREEAFRGCTIRYLNLQDVPSPVTLAWAQCDDRLILAMYPQMVRAAIDRLQAAGRSLLDNDDFNRGWSQMPMGVTSVTYLDTRSNARMMYAWMLPTLQAATGMLQAEGVDLDVSAMPAWPTIERHLYGTISGVIPDDRGVTTISLGPLPGPMTSMTRSSFVTPLLASIFLGSVGEGRVQAQRTVSATHIREICLAALMYAAEEQGYFPDELQTLVDRDLLTPDLLISPLAAEGETSSSYLYVPGQTAQHPATNVLVYEKPEHYDYEGTMVGFVDGHAEFMTYDAFQKALAETRENLSVDHQPAQPESSQMPTDSYSEVPQEPAEPEPSAEELEEQIQTARLQIDERGGTVVQKINLFRYHTRQYPSRLEDLLVEPNNIARREAKWRGPYATPEELEDPWGNQLRYQMPGQWNDRGYDLWSVGPDGIDNTDDDIVNW